MSDCVCIQLGFHAGAENGTFTKKKDELHPMSRGNCTVQAVFCLSQYRACPLTVVLYQLILATNDACLLQHIYNVYARSLEKWWGKVEGLARWTRLLFMARQVWETVQAIIHHQFCTYGRQVNTMSTQRPELRAQTLYHRHYIYMLQTKVLIGRFSQHCQG